jgi:hypothetical protein
MFGRGAVIWRKIVRRVRVQAIACRIIRPQVVTIDEVGALFARRSACARPRRTRKL